MKFLIALLLVVVSVSSVEAQCPAGTVCPTAAIVRGTPIRTFAANTTDAVRRLAWAPIRAGGSAGKTSVAYTTVETPVVVRETFATVTKQRTFKVRDWRPLVRVRSGGSTGR